MKGRIYYTTKMIESWNKMDDTIYSMDELLEWIQKRNSEVVVSIERTTLEKMDDWYYDGNEGCIRNKSRSFFQIYGIEEYDNGNKVKVQPIIFQQEIGYLGILCKEFEGVLYFLMQAKIEPGNINKIQISPTLQATRSNYLKTHGGKEPKYLTWFLNRAEHKVLIDQIQSEQSSRFYGKRNRNIIIVVEKDIEEYNEYRWMTLGQIKKLMEYDNLVNMDTRTVISCIPFSLHEYTQNELSYLKGFFHKDSIFKSFFYAESAERINLLYQYINDCKMNSQRRVKICNLFDIEGWYFRDSAFTSTGDDFEIVFCNVNIEGREVAKWQQPLFRAIRQKVFGLLMCEFDGEMLFLVRCISEIGCFDQIEIGPTVQGNEDEYEYYDNAVKLFFKKYHANEDIIFSGLFSEEGGRFYHEINRNVLLMIKPEELCSLPEGYFWVDYKTLNIMIQFNNCLNIQLRNLISIIKI